MDIFEFLGAHIGVSPDVIKNNGRVSFSRNAAGVYSLRSWDDALGAAPTSGDFSAFESQSGPTIAYARKLKRSSIMAEYDALAIAGFESAAAGPPLTYGAGSGAVLALHGAASSGASVVASSNGVPTIIALSQEQLAAVKDDLVAKLAIDARALSIALDHVAQRSTVWGIEAISLSAIRAAVVAYPDFDPASWYWAFTPSHQRTFDSAAGVVFDTNDANDARAVAYSNWLDAVHQPLEWPATASVDPNNDGITYTGTGLAAALAAYGVALPAALASYSYMVPDDTHNQGNGNGNGNG